MKKVNDRNYFLALFAIQVAIAGIYYTIISSIIYEGLLSIYYFYPIYSFCIFMSIVVGIAFWIMSVGYSYLFSLMIFKDRNKSRQIFKLIKIEKDFSSYRAVVFLRDSFIIMVLALFFYFHANGLASNIIK